MYLLPVNVLWVSKCKYTHEILERHVHSCYHLFYVKKGKGCMLINDEKLPVVENTIYFLSPGVIHGFFPDENNPTYTIEVKFLVLDEALRKSLDTFESVIKLHSNNTCVKLEELVLEALYKPALYQEIINTDYTRFLLELIRIGEKTSHNNSYQSEGSMESNIYNKVDLKNVIEYIQSNFSGHITLQDLSNIGVMSSACLCKLFNNLFNVSPMQYVNNLRITKAKELIMYSDFNITQISEMTGFQSVHYFSRYFKKKERISPVEYKNKVHENVVVLLGENSKVRSINCDAC